MTAIPDGPSTFPAEARAPWAPWAKAMEEALVHRRMPQTWPSLTRPLLANEAEPLVATILGSLKRAQAWGGAERAPVWQPAIAALAPGLRKDRGVARAFMARLWMSEESWYTKEDGGANMAQLVAAAWEEPWGPHKRPMANEVALWGTARAEAQWAYHLTQAWLSSSLKRGWGQLAVENEPPVLSPFLPLIRRLDDGLTSEPTQSHWRMWVRQVAQVQMAGLPHDPALKQLAQDWQLGWPKTWGGDGLNASAWDRPVHANLAALDNLQALKRDAIWSSPVESLFAFAMDFHLRQDTDAPRQVPTWMTWLRELLEAREGQPAENYTDLKGEKGWQTWKEKRRAKASSIPSVFAIDSPYPKRKVLWQAEIQRQEAVWDTLQRLEMAQSAQRAIVQTTETSRRRPRQRT